MAQHVGGVVGENGIGIITLDRPKALNAMNLEMDLTFKNYLDDWGKNAKVKAILVQSSSPRAFSAGMDIKNLAAAVQDDRQTPLVSKVFEAEYTLVCKIARLQKPYISIIDGITMGFGIGLSCHGAYRIVTERTLLAMPENGIGLFPDVGFAHLVAQSPGSGALGAYLALTGSRINNPIDALYAGIGTHYVRSEKLAFLKEALLRTDLSHDADATVQSVLSEFSEAPGAEGSLEKLLPSIVSCFGGGKSVVDSVAALKIAAASSESGVGEWATTALSGIAKGAPHSLWITQRHFSSVSAAALNVENELQTIDGVMKAEYCLALRTALRDDFIEGVRAVVIDKDQKPNWNPSSVEQIDISDIEECFKPLLNAPELEV